MILRNIAIRHGRRALAAPLRRSGRRCLSSEIDAIETSLNNSLNETGSIEANLNKLHATQNLITPSAGVGLPDEVVAERLRLKKAIRYRTAKLGSVTEKHYEPYHVFQNPPTPKDITLELLMASQAHMGHATGLWNPANQRYIYGIRQGLHIISLEATAAHLRRAAKVVEGVAYHAGLILFVGTRPGQDEAVVQAAELAQGCHLFERWTPGSITNGDQILPTFRVKALNEHDQEIPGYEHKFDSWRALKPDLVVCLNPLENYILLHECGLNNIPTVGIIDTDADPTWVTYPIPANDDSLRCIQLIAAVLGSAGQEGHRKRLEAAKTGVVTWFPTEGLGDPITREDIKMKAEQDRLRAEEENALQVQMEEEERGAEVEADIEEEDEIAVRLERLESESARLFNANVSDSIRTNDAADGFVSTMPIEVIPSDLYEAWTQGNKARTKTPSSDGEQPSTMSDMVREAQEKKGDDAERNDLNRSDRDDVHSKEK